MKEILLCSDMSSKYQTFLIFSKNYALQTIPKYDNRYYKKIPINPIDGKKKIFFNKINQIFIGIMYIATLT